MGISPARLFQGKKSLEYCRTLHKTYSSPLWLWKNKAKGTASGDATKELSNSIIYRQK